MCSHYLKLLPFFRYSLYRSVSSPTEIVTMFFRLVGTPTGRKNLWYMLTLSETPSILTLLTVSNTCSSEMFLFSICSRACNENKNPGICFLIFVKYHLFKEQTLNIAQLAPGIYQLHYFDGSKNQQIKFVKE